MAHEPIVATVISNSHRSLVDAHRSPDVVRQAKSTTCVGVAAILLSSLIPSFIDGAPAQAIFVTLCLSGPIGLIVGTVTRSWTPGILAIIALAGGATLQRLGYGTSAIGAPWVGGLVGGALVGLGLRTLFWRRG